MDSKGEGYLPLIIFISISFWTIGNYISTFKKIFNLQLNYLNRINPSLPSRHKTKNLNFYQIKSHLAGKKRWKKTSRFYLLSFFQI